MYRISSRGGSVGSWKRVSVLSSQLLKNKTNFFFFLKPFQYQPLVSTLGIRRGLIPIQPSTQVPKENNSWVWKTLLQNDVACTEPAHPPMHPNHLWPTPNTRYSWNTVETVVMLHHLQNSEKKHILQFIPPPSPHSQSDDWPQSSAVTQWRLSLQCCLHQDVCPYLDVCYTCRLMNFWLLTTR